MSADWLDEQLDMTGVEAFGSSGPYEEGLFRAKVESLEPETSSNGNPMLHWEFRLQEGPDKGRPVHEYSALTQNARGALLAVLHAFDDERDWSISPREIIEEVTGEEIRIHVEPDEYEGNPTANAVRFLPLAQEADDQQDENDSSDDDNEEDDIPF